MQKLGFFHFTIIRKKTASVQLWVRSISKLQSEARDRGEPPGQVDEEVGPAPEGHLLAVHALQAQAEQLQRLQQVHHVQGVSGICFRSFSTFVLTHSFLQGS